MLNFLIERRARTDDFGWKLGFECNDIRAGLPFDTLALQCDENAILSALIAFVVLVGTSAFVDWGDDVRIDDAHGEDGH